MRWRAACTMQHIQNCFECCTHWKWTLQYARKSWWKCSHTLGTAAATSSSERTCFSLSRQSTLPKIIHHFSQCFMVLTWFCTFHIARHLHFALAHSLPHHSILLSTFIKLQHCVWVFLSFVVFERVAPSLAVVFIKLHFFFAVTSKPALFLSDVLFFACHFFLYSVFHSILWYSEALLVLVLFKHCCNLTEWTLAFIYTHTELMKWRMHFVKKRNVTSDSKHLYYTIQCVLIEFILSFHAVVWSTGKRSKHCAEQDWEKST